MKSEDIEGYYSNVSLELKFPIQTWFNDPIPDMYNIPTSYCTVPCYLFSDCFKTCLPIQDAILVNIFFFNMGVFFLLQKCVKVKHV